MTQQLALDPGDNTIEVVAYNGSEPAGLLAGAYDHQIRRSADQSNRSSTSWPLALTPTWIVDGPPVGGSDFAPLGLAVKDATAFGASMQKAAGGSMVEVRVTSALDKDATRDNLEQIVIKMAPKSTRRNSFILFVAGNTARQRTAASFSFRRITRAGRATSLASDRPGPSSRLARQPQPQPRAPSSCCHTCRSYGCTELRRGMPKPRTDTPASDAAVGRLHEATGRPVLTAAAAGQFAHEGLIGETGARDTASSPGGAPRRPEKGRYQRQRLN